MRPRQAPRRGCDPLASGKVARHCALAAQARKECSEEVSRTRKPFLSQKERGGWGWGGESELQGRQRARCAARGALVMRRRRLAMGLVKKTPFLTRHKQCRAPARSATPWRNSLLARWLRAQLVPLLRYHEVLHRSAHKKFVRKALRRCGESIGGGVKVGWVDLASARLKGAFASALLGTCVEYRCAGSPCASAPCVGSPRQTRPRGIELTPP